MVHVSFFAFITCLSKQVNINQLKNKKVNLQFSIYKIQQRNLYDEVKSSSARSDVTLSGNLQLIIYSPFRL